MYDEGTYMTVDTSYININKGVYFLQPIWNSELPILQSTSLIVSISRATGPTTVCASHYRLLKMSRTFCSLIEK